ncbi:MAG: response regulator [Candidatus Electryonea clarkiae]|nr:response regulator [Candidatus Electryonea clarkiae]MDP8285259.1 response regulator [Candidatus Electryonea clarkiae]
MDNDKPKMILVVDDEDDVRNYLRLALEDDGFEVTEAINGREALEAVKLRTPDLISLDLVMPEHSGAKFNRELQKNPDWAKIPVLVVTGHARDDQGRADFEELTMSGPGIYLEKPVKPVTYVAAVRKLLGMEESSKKVDPQGLKDEIKDSLESADPEALKKALDALRNK